MTSFGKLGRKISLHFMMASVALTMAATMPTGAHAATKPFEQWLTDVRVEARQKGISQKTIDQALTGLQPVQSVIDLDRKQPEKTMTFDAYRTRIVNDIRIQKGRELMKTHARELEMAERKYGVPREYIVALWGIETNFGTNTGGYDVITALATLAWDGRRADFFKKEMFDALKIIDQGHITHANMKGSWAGAMGQNQFMPSSFHNFAVDGDGDGRKDIWTNKADVFASTANYLKTVGWKPGETWGREVKIPGSLQTAIDAEQGKDLKTRAVRSLQDWKNLGLMQQNGQPIPVVAGMRGTVIQPGGPGTQGYLIYDNYRAFMHWNKSVYFATSVGLLANEIAKGPKI
jgi:membrane-bound lytic murein transglycosylase B